MNVTGLEDFGDFFDIIFDFIYTWLGPFVVLMFVVAGLRIIISSGGSKEDRQKARRGVAHIIIGLVIILSAYLVVTETFRLLGYTERSGIEWIDDFYQR